MNAIDFFKEEDPGNNYEYSSNSNDTNWLYDKNDLVMFAERYHQAKLKLLGIANDEYRSEQLTCPRCKSTNILNPDRDNDAQCIECAFIWAG